MSDATPRVMEALKNLVDEDLGKDIVQLGLVKQVEVKEGVAHVTLELDPQSAAKKERLEAKVRAVLEGLPEVQEVRVRTALKVGVQPAPRRDPLADVRHVIAVASGKGGVGKSTVAVNLAAALQQEGAATGLLDADIYGPSIPTMLGTQEQPMARGQSIVPLEAFGLKLMSIGFLAGPQAPVIWRGPMVHQVVSQFLSSVDWGRLDYLVIDLPPGTGDAQLTLTQSARLSGAVIVTTPQTVALEDVHRGIRMFEQVKVPILGVVENMSWYECPECHHRAEIFAHGGGKTAAERYGVPFLGEVPLLPAIRETGDRGKPIVVAEPESGAAQAFLSVARAVQEQLAKRAETDGGGPRIKFS